MQQLRRAEDLVQYPYTTCFIRFAYKKAMVKFGRKETSSFPSRMARTRAITVAPVLAARYDGPRDQLKANFESLKAG